MTSFIYQIPEDLLTSQKILIDLAKHLIEYCDQVPLTLRPLYFECLTLVILRGELGLNFMGFDAELRNNLMDATPKANSKGNSINLNAFDAKNMKQKMKVASSYQTLLYQTLKKVLEFLSRGAVSENEQNFAETFCAIAYFRVPEFRNKLLACVSSSKDDDNLKTIEWRGSEWLFEPSTDERKKNKQIISLFDWDKNFYSYLKVTFIPHMIG